MSADRLFAAHFGMPRSAWTGLPVVRDVACDGDCGGAMAAATGGSDVIHPLIRIGGDATIDGPLTLGRPDRPVVIVVDGRLELRGPLTLHGVVYANGVGWSGTPGGVLRGALISGGDVAPTTGVDIDRDATVLTALMQRTGSFVRVPGSWRDF
jgi:hypothetical protein